MKQMRLIEPDHFSGIRMAGDGLADLPGSQPLSAYPFDLNAMLSAKLLDLAAITRLEDILPWKVDATLIIAKIHDFPGDEFFANFGGNAIENAMAIRDGSGAALLRRLFTIKEESSRPGVGVGILVVQWNVLVGRVFGRRIDAAAEFGARRRAVHILFKFSPHGAHHIPKSVDSAYLKSPKKNAAMFQ